MKAELKSLFFGFAIFRHWSTFLLLTKVAQTVQEAALYRDYPYEKLKKDLDNESIFQVMLVPLGIPSRSVFS